MDDEAALTRLWTISLLQSISFIDNVRKRPGSKAPRPPQKKPRPETVSKVTNFKLFVSGYLDFSPHTKILPIYGGNICMYMYIPDLLLS